MGSFGPFMKKAKNFFFIFLNCKIIWKWKLWNWRQIFLAHIITYEASCFPESDKSKIKPAFLQFFERKNTIDVKSVTDNLIALESILFFEKDFLFKT